MKKGSNRDSSTEKQAKARVKHDRPRTTWKARSHPIHHEEPIAEIRKWIRTNYHSQIGSKA